MALCLNKLMYTTHAIPLSISYSSLLNIAQQLKSEPLDNSRWISLLQQAGTTVCISKACISIKTVKNMSDLQFLLFLYGSLASHQHNSTIESQSTISFWSDTCRQWVNLAHIAQGSTNMLFLNWLFPEAYTTIQHELQRRWAANEPCNAEIQPDWKRATANSLVTQIIQHFQMDSFERLIQMMIVRTCNVEISMSEYGTSESRGTIGTLTKNENQTLLVSSWSIVILDTLSNCDVYILDAETIHIESCIRCRIYVGHVLLLSVSQCTDVCISGFAERMSLDSNRDGVACFVATIIPPTIRNSTHAPIFMPPDRYHAGIDAILEKRDGLWRALSKPIVLDRSPVAAHITANHIQAYHLSHIPFKIATDSHTLGRTRQSILQVIPAAFRHWTEDKERLLQKQRNLLKSRYSVIASVVADRFMGWLHENGHDACIARLSRMQRQK